LASLATLRARALPYTDEDARLDDEKDPLRAQLGDIESLRTLRLAEVPKHPEGSVRRQRAQEGVDVYEQEIAALKPRVGRRHTWRFSDAADQKDHDALAQLAARVESLTDPERGSLVDVERRLERARTLVARTIDDHRAAWDAARAAIADPRVCPAYGGLVLKPQVGLVPIGIDPESYFYEFAVPETGELVERGADGRLVLTDRMAVVLVLLPGGKFTLGAQKKDRNAPAYDELAEQNESPVRTLELRPFFASKFEMTQAQWSSLGGGRPSNYDSYAMMMGPVLTVRHPVENISWPEARDMFARVDLLLPTEAQWEYFARAGTTTPWFTGDTADTLEGYANVPDKTAVDLGESFAMGMPWSEIEDGYPYTAPVGTYLPNGFGLHDVSGNVGERCRDGHGEYDVEFDPHDGFRDARGDSMRVVRGGDFGDGPAELRTAKRLFQSLNHHWITTGVRPVRKIDD
jgi:formylglycine-generating enzyme required for sulfatase activity